VHRLSAAAAVPRDRTGLRYARVSVLIDRARTLRQRTGRATSALLAYRRGNTFARTAIRSERGLPPSTPGPLERYFDANLTGPGLWKWRHYFPIYEKHLSRFVGQSPTVLEVGIFSGGSLRMWHEYFGSGTHIVGVDIEPACRAYADDTTSVLIGDQADPRFLDDVVAAAPQGYDIVLDDGGHQSHQQIATLEAVLNHIRPGGVYICEDIHTAGHAFHSYIAGLARNLHWFGGLRMDTTPFQAAIDSVSLYPFVVVIEKAATARDRLEAPKHGSEWQPFYASADGGISSP
jgi:SAM-dependent methyltransferase